MIDTRKLATAALLASMALAALDCKRQQSVPVGQTIEEGTRLASALRMGDPKAETQLISGFYGIEGGAWRWTGGKFTAVLKVPFGASQRGGTLTLALTVPQAVLDKLNTVSLAAAVDGKPLPPESYTQPGPAEYKRDIPASMLAPDSVKIDFQLDRSWSPGGADRRELGIVANALSLEPK